MAEYLIVLVVAALVTWLLTPWVRRAAIRLGAVVSPDHRRVHERPTPTLGGAAMYGGFLAAMAAASVLPQFRAVFRGTSEPLGLLVGATTMFAVGALDDLRDVSPPAKLAGQVFSGSLLSILGITLLFFRIPFAGFVVLSPDLSALVTVLWVVGMANITNFIDGLDGLAAGIVAIAAAALFVYSTRLSDAGLLEPG
ncbi:MAG TPA: MraY family glycosyltransferase, partial [Acidimicrobiia bacterium]|nr:MraY family glycosyltransferase [Acidimicrobiia bacterium]